MDVLLVAQAAVPEINGAYLLALASRVLHILGAIVLLGGIAYLRKVVAPGAARRGSDSPEELYGGRRTAWAKWVGISTLLIIVSGIYNYLLVVRSYEKMPGAYHMLFGVKFLLALVVFFLAATLAGKTDTAQRFRGQSIKWLTICLAAGIGLVVLASILRSFPHIPIR